MIKKCLVLSLLVTMLVGCTNSNTNNIDNTSVSEETITTVAQETTTEEVTTEAVDYKELAKKAMTSLNTANDHCVDLGSGILNAWSYKKRNHLVFTYTYAEFANLIGIDEKVVPLALEGSAFYMATEPRVFVHGEKEMVDATVICVKACEDYAEISDLIDEAKQIIKDLPHEEDYYTVLKDYYDHTMEFVSLINEPNGVNHSTLDDTQKIYDDLCNNAKKFISDFDFVI